MICLTPKTSQKSFRNNWSFLWPPLSPEHNPLDYALWSVLQKKMKTTSLSNNDSLKTFIKEEQNKMSRSHADTAAMWNKFTVLCLFYYFVVCFFFLSHTHFLESQIILFYNRAVLAHCPCGRELSNGPRNQGSISGQAIPKTQKMVLDNSLFNTQHYKVRFKGKVEQSGGRSKRSPLHLGEVAIEKEVFG